MDKRKRRLLCMLEGGKKYKWIRGAPPLSFKAFAAGALENYRIYGNTVGGESVGDRTGNLFDMSSVYAIGYIDDSGNIAIAQGYAITTYDFIPIDQNSSYSIKICGKLNANTNQRKARVAFYDRDQIFIGRIGLGEVSDVRTFNAINNSHYIRLSIDDGNTNIMLNAGSAPLPYEPYGYKVPVTINDVTTNLYLPEPIKMVGSEAEYIDYAEQKLHRIGADDINVTLPALPTLPGTNVLSVGTAVQPSRVEVKGRIKAVGQEPEPEAAEAEQE